MSFNNTIDHPLDSRLPMNWKNPPEFRGTIQILFTCLSTLIFCVWGALHVDIERRTKKAALLHKMGWVLCSIFTPEVLIIIAYLQRRGASQLVLEHNKYYRSSNSSNPDAEKNQDQSYEEGLPLLDRRFLSQYSWTLTHGFYATMGGFVIDIEEYAKDTSQQVLPLPDVYGNRATLTIEGVHFLLKHAPGFIPDISKDSIMDHSKADGIAKTLQVVQASWFCINCTFRRAQGLPLSLLEVYTLAHAICMLVVYILWLHKPLEIREPTFIRGEFAPEICALLCALVNPDHKSLRDIKSKPLADRARDRLGLHGFVLGYDSPLIVDRARLSDPRSIDGIDDAFLEWLLPIVCVLLGGLYGGIHCLPWNNDFPTLIERQLWRIAAIILSSAAAVSAVVILIGNYLSDKYPNWLGKGCGWICMVSIVLCSLLYCIANLYILVESFRQLLYLPPQAYQLPVWSNYWPHFG